MKCKNLLLALGAFIVLGTVSISCKKDKPFTTVLTGTTWFLSNPNNPNQTFPEILTLKFGNDAKLTGVFNGLNFLPGSTYTFSNNTVVGIFKFMDPDFNTITTAAFGGVLNADGTKITGSLGEAPNNNQLDILLTKQ